MNLDLDLDLVKKDITTNVYHIPSDKKVPLHSHAKHDELFYCIKGHGYGVLEDSEVELTVGKVFVVPAGTSHALRSDSHLWVSSFLIPVVPQD